MDATEKAKYVIEHNTFMIIATADGDGKPWVSPVGFVFDEAFNLYWVSSKEALHSRNITARPEVAISIFGPMPEGGFDGVYIDAMASELTDGSEIETAIKLFQAKRPQPPRFAVQSLADVTGDAAWRIYKATPGAVSKRVDSTLNGQAITTREAISL